MDDIKQQVRELLPYVFKLHPFLTIISRNNTKLCELNYRPTKPITELEAEDTSEEIKGRESISQRDS